MAKSLTQSGERLLRDLAMSGEGTLCRPRRGGDRQCMEALHRRGLLRRNTAADCAEWPYVLNTRGFELGDALSRAYYAEQDRDEAYARAVSDVVEALKNAEDEPGLGVLAARFVEKWAADRKAGT